MSDPGMVDGWTVVGWLWKALLTLGAWIGVTQIKRLDQIEEALKSKSVKADTDKETERLEQTMREHHSETREGFAQVNSRLDSILERMAK